MSLPFRAFFVGWGRALARPRLALLLYAINLLLSAAVAVPVYRLASGRLALDPEVGRLLVRYDAWYAGDLLAAHDELLAGVRAGTGVAAVVFLLAFCFVGGGFYRTLADRAYRPRLADLLADGARCSLRFLRLLVPAAVAAWLLALLNEQASRALTAFFDHTLERSASATTLGLGLVGKTLLFLWLLVLLVTAPLQFARTEAALGRRRSMLRGYLAGVVLALRRPFSVGTLFVLSALAPLALLVCHDRMLEALDASQPWRPLASLGWRFDPALPYWLVVLLFEQGLVLLFALSFTARTGAFVALHEETARRPAPPAVPPPPPPSPFVADSPGSGATHEG